LDIIRKILLLSFNTKWAVELRNDLNEDKKISTVIASIRSDASSLISEEKFSTLVFEESFTAKNVNVILRGLVAQNLDAPKYIILLASDVEFIKEIQIPDNLNSRVLFYSIPIKNEILKSLIKDRLMLVAAKKTSELDQEFSKAVLKATIAVIKTFPGVEDSLKSEKAFKYKDDLNIAIRGKIIIKSEFFQGSILICFPKTTYLKIYEVMTSEKHADINDINVDFAGEVANMVYGQVKKILSQQGVNLEMAIPVIDRSQKLNSTKSIFVIPFSTSLGQLYVKVAQDLF
jgi:CheY-specific phosphatase CheX